MMNQVSKKMAAAAAMGLAAFVSFQASAGEFEETYVEGRKLDADYIRIQYSSDALANAAGREELMARIEHAASAVCGPADLREAGSLKLANRNRDCFESAVDDALTQVDAGQVATR